MRGVGFDDLVKRRLHRRNRLIAQHQLRLSHWWRQLPDQVWKRVLTWCNNQSHTHIHIPGVEAHTYLKQQPITHTYTPQFADSGWLYRLLRQVAADLTLQNYGYVPSCKASLYQIIHHEEEKRNHFSFMNKSVNTRCGSAYLPEATTNHTHIHTYTPTNLLSLIASKVQSSGYAVGDVIEGRPELTLIAIQAARLLACRLFAGHTLQVAHFVSWLT